jgi:hypothetical protein
MGGRIMEIQIKSESYWSGFALGILMTLLTVLAADKLLSTPQSLQTSLDLPKDIVGAYRLGIADALKTNPASWQLEETCLEVWSNKQK